ncbi:MAG: phenylacetate--CoA ligase, partial [Treponema sp.]|nr:phenylacetate--CoA ligase [Treponema sp.]
MMTFQYWNERIETLPRAELVAYQVQRLKNVVDIALRTPFYRQRLAEAGIHGAEDLKTLADLRRIPFTTKRDLRDGFPYGFLSVPKDEVVRLHASSGTTGTPTTIYFNKEDIARWTDFV